MYTNVNVGIQLMCYVVMWTMHIHKKCKTTETE